MLTSGEGEEEEEEVAHGKECTGGFSRRCLKGLKSLKGLKRGFPQIYADEPADFRRGVGFGIPKDLKECRHLL